MNKLSLNDIAALMMVLDDITVEELLHNAMLGFATKDTVHDLDCADLCSKSLSTFSK